MTRTRGKRGRWESDGDKHDRTGAGGTALLRNHPGFSSEPRVFTIPEQTPRMAATNPFRTALIALCGMDCAICMAYLRTKNRCQGCHSPDRLHHRNFFLFSCREEKAGFVTLVRGSLPAAQAARYTLQDKIQ